MTAQAPIRPAFYWSRYTNGDGRWKRKEGPPGAELAALRRGVNRNPGDAPEMWRFYTDWSDGPELSPAMRADHLALTLYAIHQQSRSKPMHAEKVGIGAAVRQLRHSGKVSEEAVDRRFAAAATATSLDELAMHVRGLVRQLNDISQPMDYTRLYWDLRNWQDADKRADVRRQWGAQYFRTKPKPADSTSDDEQEQS